ncbi:MAG: hypothetical protein JST41_13605 [Bacteroidetes bacterium]|nr:hypothetical protein [Bacteroidota bacterium]MCC6656382.1 hypothetical protein [Flavobacteriales bacterium]
MGNTSERVDLLVDLSLRTVDGGSDEFHAWCQEAQQLSRKLRYAPGLAMADLEQALTAFRTGDQEEAIRLLEPMILRLDSLGFDQGFGAPLAFLRVVQNAAGKQQDRYDYYTAALHRYEGTELNQSLAMCHHAIAGYYYRTRQYGAAVEHYMKARAILQEANPGDAPNETMVIGWCYEDWGNPQRAIVLLREALEDHKRLNDQATVSEIHLHLANDELALGDTTAALQDFDRSRAQWHVLDDANAAIFRSRYIQAMLRMGRMEEAELELITLRDLVRRAQVPLTSNHGTCEVDYCGYLFHQLRGEPVLADSLLAEALREALRLSDLPLVLKYRKAFATRLGLKGDHESALREASMYIHLNDSLLAITNAEAVAAYESQVKERDAALEIQRQHHRVKRQRILLIAAISGALLLSALAWSVHRGKKRSDELLLNILPAEVARELKNTGSSEARHIEQATILFTDFQGFTEASERLTPQELVEELDTCFKAFDAIITTRGIEKIKTIGDAYMAAGGLQRQRPGTVAEVVHAALDMQDFMRTRKAERTAKGRPAFDMRVGIHTGPVVAGIVGVKKFQYDIWGDTVNTANRMESSGEVGRVNISEATYALVKDAKKVREVNGEWPIVNGGSIHSPTPDHHSPATAHSPFTNSHSPAFVFTPRGRISAKGKGELEMYFVERG